jgi:hypothetical protein
MSLDSELLARRGQQEKQASEKEAGERAGNLRAAQRGGVPYDAGGRGQTDSQAGELSLRETVQAERRSQLQKAKAKAKKAMSQATAPARRATSNLLKQAWQNIIPSYGLTIIWINIHVFLGMIFGNNFFCKLGAEWIDENIKKAQADKAKDLEKMAGVAEGAGLACLDLGCLLLIVILLCLVGMIVGYIENPMEAIKALFGWLWGYVSGK